VELRPALHQALDATPHLYRKEYRKDHVNFNAQSDIGAEVWSEMGELLLQPPFDNTWECLSIVKGVFDDFDEALSVPEKGEMMPQQFLAAVCFHNAAQMLHAQVRKRPDLASAITSHHKAQLRTAVDFYSRSAALIQKLDLSSALITTYQRALVQNTCQYSCYMRWRAQGMLETQSKKMTAYRNAAFIEKVKTAENWDLVLQQPDLDEHEKIHYLVKKTHLLSSASGFAPSLKRASEVADQALAAVQAAWDLIPADLRNQQGEADSEEETIRHLLKTSKTAADRARQLHVAEVMRKKTAQSNSSWIPGFLRPLVKFITER